MLHICTPLFREYNLQKIYDSIIDENEIIWHISAVNSKQIKPLNEYKKQLKVNFYRLNCLDSDTVTKRNEIFNHLNDGYFCLLDDDTLFHPNMFSFYKKLKEINYIGLAIGLQLKANNSVRLYPKIPQNCCIDTGNALAHVSCLKECKWPLEKTKTENRDFLFWNSVFNFFSKKHFTIHHPISIYNKLN